MAKRDRRQFLKSAAVGTAGAALPGKLLAAVVTPGSAEGPFYPTPAMRFPDVDNDLVKIAGLVRDAGGEIFRLTGQVRNRSGQLIAGARVEIWQVDANARYLHTGDRGGNPRDGGFQGFGHDITDQDGRYRFRTIKPVPYPGRTPHIHVKVIAADRELTTQFFIADHPSNARDSLYRRMSAQERRAVEMRFTTVDGEAQAVVDINL